MKMLVALLLLTVTTQAHANAYKCVSDIGHEYLVVIDLKKSTASIFGKVDKLWETRYLEAEAVQVESGSWTVNGTDNTTITKWKEDECFRRVQDSMFFTLLSEQTGATGQVVSSLAVGLNPYKNPKDCPIPRPSRPRPEALTCTKL